MIGNFSFIIGLKWYGVEICVKCLKRLIFCEDENYYKVGGVLLLLVEKNGVKLLKKVWKKVGMKFVMV